MLCNLAKTGNTEEMKKYIKEFSNIKENFSNDIEITYPYNVAFNAHNYDFATEYQNVIIEVLGEDVWQTEF